MSRYVSSLIHACVAATAAVLVLGWTTPAAGQTADETPESTADTTAVDGDAGRKPTGRVRISIDESGISVEGEARRAGDEGEWVEVRDERGFREKGVDVVKFGESVLVARDEVVRGDLIVFGDNAVIEGRVGGNVVVLGGNVRARSGAEIKGDVVVLGGTLEEDDDVLIHGERVVLEDFITLHNLDGLFGYGDAWIWRVLLPLGLFVKLVLAFIVLLFMRERVAVAGEHLAASYLKGFGAGLLAVVLGLIALVIVMVPLVITLVGIPIAILLVVSCVGVFIIGWAIFACTLGRMIAERLQLQTTNPYAFVLIGALVITLPDIVAFGLSIAHVGALLPVFWAFKVFAWMVRSFAYVSGLGAIVLSRFGGRALLPPAGAGPAPAPSQSTGPV